MSPLFVRSANVLVSKSFCLWSYSNLLDSFCGIVDLTTVPVYRAASVLDKQVKPLVFVCWLNCLHVQWYYRHGMTHMWLFNCANVLTRISRVWSDCLLICIVLATRVLWPVVSFLESNLRLARTRVLSSDSRFYCLAGTNPNALLISFTYDLMMIDIRARLSSVKHLRAQSTMLWWYSCGSYLLIQVWFAFVNHRREL